jgi:hypothetical protein
MKWQAIFLIEMTITGIAVRPSPRCVTATAPSKGRLSNKTALAMIFKLAEAAEKSWSPQWSQPVAENHPTDSRLSDRKLKQLPPDPFRHQDSAIAP